MSFATKSVTLPGRLSTARSQGGGVVSGRWCRLRASSCIYHQENLAENERLGLALANIMGQRCVHFGGVEEVASAI